MMMKLSKFRLQKVLKKVKQHLIYNKNNNKQNNPNLYAIKLIINQNHLSINN